MGRYSTGALLLFVIVGLALFLAVRRPSPPGPFVPEKAGREPTNQPARDQKVSERPVDSPSTKPLSLSAEGPNLSSSPLGASARWEPEPPHTQLSEEQSRKLSSLTAMAEQYAETFSPPGYTPPPIPPELESKLAEVSPELLNLVRIISRIPPRDLQATQSPTLAPTLVPSLFDESSAPK